jgi:hypothetical protein
MCVPVLSPGQLVRYLEKMPFKPAATEKSHMNASLPHHFAWSFGWEEMVANVARMYHGLPPEQRAKTAIFGNNFAEAGAVDFFGPRYGLPKAIGGHQNYWLWGPRNYTGESVIVIGDSARHLRELCEQVEVGPTIEDPYARPVEKRPILLCRGLKWNLRQNWPQVKSWR